MIINAATAALVPHHVGAAAAVTASKLGPAVFANNIKNAMILRGGATSAAAVALKDFGSEVDGYFGGIRTPASLILGASLGALFTDINEKDEMRNKSRAERHCTRLYNTVSCGKEQNSFGFEDIETLI